MSELLDTKGLASKLGKHVNYIYAMRSHGFKMPAGLTTVELAFAWLGKHKPPRSRKWSGKR